MKRVLPLLLALTMARSVSLPSLGLSPFGGSTSSFDAFSVASRSERAYLEFRKVEIKWENGQLSNDEYLAALQLYAGKLKAGSSERLNAEQRVVETTYRLDRQKILVEIDKGTKTLADLLTFDKAKLEGLREDSAEYQSRLDTMRSTQNEIFNKAEEEVSERFSDGKMTAAQLQTWYEEQLAGLGNNPDLAEAITKRIGDVQDRVQDERDQKMLKDFSEGKVGYASFLSYATNAQARYVKGTAEYDDWADRIENARDQAIESPLLYRYGLTQKYAQLAKFVKDYSTAPTGGVSTSTSTRVVLGADGQWKTVKTTSSKAYGPSPSEQAAWKERQVEVAAAKKQMALIKKQIDGQPGGWVSTDDMIRYYTKIQKGYVKGTADWYNVQERIDGLQQQKLQEQVLAKQGVRITYPKAKQEAPEYGSSGWKDPLAPKTTTAATAKPKAATAQSQNIGIDQFMKAIASVESGGRYNAVNKSSGAYGKYQIMPANWSGWAAKYLGNSSAPMTPENQEKVARGKFTDLYKWLGSWEAVAHWWLSGGSDKALHNDPSRWSSTGKAYVDKVMGKLGVSPARVTSGQEASGGYTFPGTGTGGATGPNTAVGSTGAGSPAAGAARAGGSAAVAPGSKAPTQAGKPDTWIMQKLRFPVGLDGRAFEKFYSRFIDAFENGEEVFVDYSSGRAVSYFIPTDIDLRAELVAELDDLRVRYYVARAGAYAGTASGIVAANNASDAVKDSASNQIKVLDMITAKDAAILTAETDEDREAVIEKKTTYGETKVAGRERIYEPESGGTQKTPTATLGRTNLTPAQAAAASNAIGAGKRLVAETEAALSMYAKLGQEALKRGDLEAAYAYTQLGIDLVAHNQPLIATYEASAKQRLGYLVGQGGKADSETLTDLGDLSEALGKDAFSQPMKKLEDVVAEVHKYVDIDPATDEPRTYYTGGADDNFVLKSGTRRVLTPSGEIKFEQKGVEGFGADASKNRVTVNIKIGNQFRQVEADYKVVQIGTTATGQPVYGKLISGFYDGKQYAWVENPLKPGTWMSASNVGKQGVSFAAPSGAKAVELSPGSGDYQFEWKQNGKTYRVAFDKRDGVARVYVLKGSALFGGGEEEWAEYVPKEGDPSTVDLLKGAGWGADPSVFVGSDKDWKDTQGGPWIGTTKAERDKFLANTRTISTPGETKGDWKMPGSWNKASLSLRAQAAARFNDPAKRNLDLLDTDAPKSKTPVAAPPLSQRDNWYEDEQRTAVRESDIATRKVAALTTLRAKSATGTRAIDRLEEEAKPKAKIKPVAKPPVSLNKKTGVAVTAGKKKVVAKPKPKPKVTGSVTTANKSYSTKI